MTLIQYRNCTTENNGTGWDYLSPRPQHTSLIWSVCTMENGSCNKHIGLIASIVPISMECYYHALGWFPNLENKEFFSHS